MIQIRSGVFETNSSSTHSLTMCTQEEFDKWVKGELVFDSWNDCFAEPISLSEEDKENAKEKYNYKKGSYWKEWEQLSEDEIESWYAKYANEYLRSKKAYDGLKTYAEWHNDYDLNKFTYHYTSPSGDEIVAFGKYGYDG